MGMYTEMNVSFELDYSKLDEYSDILRFMTGDLTIDRNNLVLPDHSLFRTGRWEHMLCSSSYYFAGETHSEFHVEEDFKLVTLTSLSSLKNYGDEIEKFCDWVSQYVYLGSNHDSVVFAGYKRYEEDISPTLIYFKKDGVKLVETPSVD